MGILSKANDATKGEETPEKGFMTTVDWAKSEGWSESWTCTVLRKLVREGSWEKRTYKKNVGGKIYPVPHYREKP